MPFDASKPENDQLLINFPPSCRANWDALALLTDANLQITNAKVAPAAGIVDTKLAQITTASKVHGSSLTGLANVVAGAGVLPSANTSNKLKADAADTTPQYLDSLINTSMFQISGSDTLEYKDGGIAAAKLAPGVLAFRSGDQMLSSNSSAPSGWTDVSGTYNNKFIRISSGSPLTTSGADTHTHGVGSYAAPSHSHPQNMGSANPSSAISDDIAASSGVGQQMGHVVEGGLSLNFVLTGVSANGAGAITGSSASGDNVPAYVQLRIFQKD